MWNQEGIDNLNSFIWFSNKVDNTSKQNMNTNLIKKGFKIGYLKQRHILHSVLDITVTVPFI